MKFHDIDSYNFDALGPMRVQRVTTATFPVFTALTDTGRVLYNTDTQKFYYGDNDSWVEFANASDLSAHIAATAAHGATGAVVGTTNPQTLTNKNLTTPTISDLTNAQHDHSTAAKGGLIPAASLPLHTHAGAGQGGTVSHTALTDKGTNTHATIDSHISNTTTAHGGPYSTTGHTHPLSTTGAAGFLRTLPNISTQRLNGQGNWMENSYMVFSTANLNGLWWYADEWGGSTNPDVPYTNATMLSLGITPRTVLGKASCYRYSGGVWSYHGFSDSMASNESGVPQQTYTGAYTIGAGLTGIGAGAGSFVVYAFAPTSTVVVGYIKSFIPGGVNIHWYRGYSNGSPPTPPPWGDTYYELFLTLF